MTQSHLNHLMILNYYTYEDLSKSDLELIANEFIDAKPSRSCIFEKLLQSKFGLMLLFLISHLY